MRKILQFFFYSSFFLIISGIIILFLGWIPFSYPNNYRGVLYYKDHGYEQSLIKPLNWNWSWRHLLPGNSIVYVVSNRELDTSITLYGSLPSASAYSDLTEQRENFDYEINLKAHAKIKESELVKLYEQEILTESFSLKPLEKIFKDSLEKKSNEWLSKNILLESGQTNEILTNFKNFLENSISNSLTYLEEISIEINSSKLPDLLLYQKAQKIINSLMEEIASIKRSESLKEAQKTATEDNRILWLEKYGKLLKEYPQLIELFKTDNIKLFTFFKE